MCYNIGVKKRALILFIGAVLAAGPAAGQMSLF